MKEKTIVAIIDHSIATLYVETISSEDLKNYKDVEEYINDNYNSNDISWSVIESVCILDKEKYPNEIKIE